MARNDSRKRPRARRNKSSALFAGSLCWFALTSRRFASLCLGLCSVYVGLCWFMLVCVQFVLVYVGFGVALCEKNGDSRLRQGEMTCMGRPKATHSLLRAVTSPPHCLQGVYVGLRSLCGGLCHFVLVYVQFMLVYVGLCWFVFSLYKPVPRSKPRTS